MHGGKLLQWEPSEAGEEYKFFYSFFSSSNKCFIKFSPAVLGHVLLMACCMSAVIFLNKIEFSRKKLIWFFPYIQADMMVQAVYRLLNAMIP
jgi:hypothetical protein